MALSEQTMKAVKKALKEEAQGKDEFEEAWEVAEEGDPQKVVEAFSQVVFLDKDSFLEFVGGLKSDEDKAALVEAAESDEASWD